MPSYESSQFMFLFFYYFIVLFVMKSNYCSCEWTNGGLASTYQHPEEPGESYTTAYINVTYKDPLNNRLLSEKSEIAKFGGAHVFPAQGVLIHVSSVRGEHTGCALPFRSSTNPYETLSAMNEPWLALVRRGGCNFQVKIDNAYRSNASGIIIYNDRDKPVLEKMKLSPVDINSNMSAVFTYKWKGEELAHLVDNGTRVYAHITIASHCTRPYNTINSAVTTVAVLQKSSPIINALCGLTMPIHRCAMLTSVLFVSISFIVLMIISLAWLVFYYVQRFRYIHAKDRLSRRLCTAAKKALSKIPTKHIKAEDKKREIQGEGECCAICIEPYKTSEIVRILPCKHEFHRSCIDPWLLEHRTCPMCKMDILKHYGFVFTGSQESILHMDIEEAISDTDSVHQPSLSPVPHLHNIQTNGISLVRSLTPDLLSRTSRSSTPDEYSPALPAYSTVGTIQGNAGLPVFSSRSSNDKKKLSQMRRSVSLDNCDLPSTSH